ncbi:hypothetical protein HNR46_003982 [Haloferula luteola]|uniref:Uncharacterized protein n=1 Tax=Haloferula luteola TaxID=595692 RepID=A0A840VM68_9BACT|nr:hypothetical protein [Haloferula luteola]
MLEIPEAPRGTLGRLDSAVKAFGCRVGGSSCLQLGSRPVRWRLSLGTTFSTWGMSGAACPSVQVLEVGFGKGHVAAVSKLAK